jgi:hypothetical protein
LDVLCGEFKGFFICEGGFDIAGGCVVDDIVGVGDF